VKYFLLCTFVLVSVAHAEVYQWRDGEGMLHFGDKPPEDSNARQVEIKQNQNVILADNPQVNGNTQARAVSDRVDSLVCKAKAGNRLPRKLCDSSNKKQCLFRTDYLGRLVKPEAIKDEIAEQEFEQLKQRHVPGTLLWTYQSPSQEWDQGTGIRGYVLLKGKTERDLGYLIVVMYQGRPNLPPNGGPIFLPEKGRPKQCDQRDLFM